MNEFPLCCPLAWCPKSETPMDEEQYVQHQRQEHSAEEPLPWDFVSSIVEWPTTDYRERHRNSRQPAVHDGGERSDV